MGMNAADWIIVAAIGISVLHAASQGFFLEACSLAGVIAGYLIAAWEYRVVSNWLSAFVHPASVADFAGFLLIFLAVVLLAGILGRIVSWGVRKAGLGWADRVLGAAFGLIRGFLVVTVFTLAVAAFSPGTSWLAHSSFAPYLLAVGRAGTWLAPAEVRSKVQEGVELLRTRQRSEIFNGSFGGLE